VSARLDELKEEAAKLSDSERAELALTLIDSLEDPTSDSDVEQAWRAEVERRAAELMRGEVQATPGDEVFARVRRHLG
jgi:putative addiction module component (TIGR02574 family)